MPRYTLACNTRAVIGLDPEAGRISIDLFEVERDAYDAAIPRGPERYHEPKDGQTEFWSKGVDLRRYDIHLTLHTDEPPKGA